MRSHRLPIAILTGMLALSAAGCASDPDPKESSAALRKVRTQIIAEVKEVGTLLSSGGATVADASGRFRVCGSAPTTSMEYAGGGRVSGDASPIAGRIEEAVAGLKSSGWKVTDASSTGTPFANLAKGELRLSLRPDVLKGSDALTFSIGGDCLRVTNSQVGEFGKTDQITPKS